MQVQVTAGLGNRPISISVQGCFLLIAEDEAKKRLRRGAESHNGINERFGQVIEDFDVSETFDYHHGQQQEGSQPGIPLPDSPILWNK